MKRVKTPPPRDYGSEITDTMRSQIMLQPELYAAEEKWAPRYQDLSLRLLGQAAPQLMQIYRDDIYPGLSEMSLDAESRQREADILSIEQLGPRSMEALRGADPRKAGLLDSLTDDAEAGMAAGNRLTPRQSRNVTQAGRAAYAARGIVHSPNAVLGEVVSNSMAGEAEQDRRRALAAGVIGERARAYGDPFAQIMARPSAVSAMAPGYMAGAGGFDPGQIFQPESQYAADLIAGNRQTKLAADTATSANNTAIIGAIMQMIGGVAGRAVGKGG